jgi:tetratricopeptide (TPR) repeat protein
MKPLLSLLTLVLAGAVSAAVSLWMRPDEPAVRTAPETAPAGALAERCERLEARQAELLRSVDDLRMAMSAVQSESSREAVPGEAAVELDEKAIDAALARWFARNSTEDRSLASKETEGESARDLVAQLLDPELDGLAEEELWQRLREEKRLDEVIAAFEERAAANPDDPGAQVELGGAYLEKIQEVAGGPLAGVWATKADNAFDRALELDPEHWEGRFHKAVALSFWPPVFGKQNEAIHHFEVLVSQQAGRGNQKSFAQTHLLLGNLYQQMGATDKALAAWEHGLSIFPDDEELRNQIELTRRP